MPEPSGESIPCARCAGHGAIPAWDGPLECTECGGSGKQWRYPSGVIARYYGGPLCGREPTKKEKPDAV